MPLAERLVSKEPRAWRARPFMMSCSMRAASQGG